MKYLVASTSRSSSGTPSQSSRGTTNTVRHIRQQAYIPRQTATSQPDESIEHRRRVYREHLYSLHIGSNPISGYRDFTPQTFASSPLLQSKARKWIRRELRVFEYLYASPTTAPDRRANNAEFLLEYIIAILQSVDIQGASGQARQIVGEYIGRLCAGLFLHELRGWLRSPFVKLEEWDGRVQYKKDGKRGEGSRPTRRVSDGAGPERLNGTAGERTR